MIPKVPTSAPTSTHMGISCLPPEILTRILEETFSTYLCDILRAHGRAERRTCSCGLGHRDYDQRITNLATRMYQHRCFKIAAVSKIFLAITARIVKRHDAKTSARRETLKAALVRGGACKVYVDAHRRLESWTYVADPISRTAKALAQKTAEHALA